MLYCSRDRSLYSGLPWSHYRTCQLGDFTLKLKHIIVLIELSRILNTVPSLLIWGKMTHCQPHEVKISWWVCISIHLSFFAFNCYFCWIWKWPEVKLLIGWVPARDIPEMIWETFFMPCYLSHLGCILLSQDYLGVLYMTDEKLFFPYSQLLATLKNV